MKFYKYYIYTLYSILFLYIDNEVLWNFKNEIILNKYNIQGVSLNDPE